jgi:hypothetical protein
MNMTTNRSQTVVDGWSSIRAYKDMVVHKKAIQQMAETACRLK